MANITITGDQALVGDGREAPVLGAGIALAQSLVSAKHAPAGATLYVRKDGTIRYRVTARGTWPVNEDDDGDEFDTPNGKMAEEIEL